MGNKTTYTQTVLTEAHSNPCSKTLTPTLLHFALVCLRILRVFYKLEVCGNPASTKSYQRHFVQSICSLCVSVSPFGNLHYISNLFIIFIFVTVINDQCSRLTESSLMVSSFQQESGFLITVRALFRHNALLTDYCTMYT